MFILGINTGLRISDILNLKVKDFIFKDHLDIKIKKPGKNKFFLINDNLKHELSNYIGEFKLKSEDYLISSRKLNSMDRKNPLAGSRLIIY
jgi:integrase